MALSPESHSQSPNFCYKHENPPGFKDLEI